MELTLTLALPRDQRSVPLVRRILAGSLTTLGVAEESISDIEVALTEACSNVLKHTDGDEEYEVCCGIRGTHCLIKVIDRGVGFDAAREGLDEATPSAENGRGIQLMRALVDEVRFDHITGDGTVVQLEKQLAWRTGAALSPLERGRPAS